MGKADGVWCPTVDGNWYNQVTGEVWTNPDQQGGLPLFSPWMALGGLIFSALSCFWLTLALCYRCKRSRAPVSWRPLEEAPPAYRDEPPSYAVVIGTVAV